MKIAKKLGEEAVEAVSCGRDRDAIIREAPIYYTTY